MIFLEGLLPFRAQLLPSELNNHSPGVSGKVSYFCFHALSCSDFSTFVQLTKIQPKQKVFILRWQNTASTSLRTAQTHRKKLQGAETSRDDVILISRGLNFHDAYCSEEPIIFIKSTKCCYFHYLQGPICSTAPPSPPHKALEYGVT